MYTLAILPGNGMVEDRYKVNYCSETIWRDEKVNAGMGSGLTMTCLAVSFVQPLELTTAALR